MFLMAICETHLSRVDASWIRVEGYFALGLYNWNQEAETGVLDTKSTPSLNKIYGRKRIKCGSMGNQFS